jgi:phage repressor protein C with HTH and peptisase S24 domain
MGDIFLVYSTDIDDYIREKLHEAINASGMTQAEITKRAKLGDVTLNRLLRGSRKGTTNATLVKIASVLNLPVSYFFGEELPPSPSPEDSIMIPVYGNVQASAGNGLHVLDEDPTDFRYLPVDLLPKKNGNYKMIFVSGDSMSPTLNPGEPILIDVDIKTIYGNGVYIIRIDGELYVKRLDKRIDGSTEVISDNPIYGRYDIHPNGHQIDIIGKVVMTFKKL